tara:strand:+ start:10773 stop:11504 length:732 start_codon:yes stop_codon:yes gene_type:complete
MIILETFVILFLIIFQSIFGIGLLVFGTPTLMILGYQYSDILSVLLPISCSISLIQIITAQKHDVKKFTIEFIKFSLPGIIIFLPIVILFISNFYLNFLIAVIMIILSFISIFKFKMTQVKKVISNKIILFFIGSIHGVSNLGGGFISIFSSKYFYGDKFKVRKAIAIAYLLFGITQILVLNIINVFTINKYILYYIIFALLSFYISNLLFKKINFINYSRILYLIVLIYGFAYIYLSILNLN